MPERKWCAIDAEGDIGHAGLIGVAVYSDRQQEYLTEHDDILDALYQHAMEGYTFVSHNAPYDVSVVWWQLGLPMKVTEYNGIFNKGTWRYDRKRPLAELWDSLELSGRSPLAEVGAAIGLPKYPRPQRLQGKDADRYEWKCDAHGRWECEPCYALRDAQIVYTFMEGLTQLLHGWGCVPRRNLGAIAVDVWRALDRPEPIALDDWTVKDIARAAYVGSRVECFKLGHIQPCYMADISSAYGAAMLSTPYPDPRRLHVIREVKPSQINWDLEGVAEVRIVVPEMHLPPLPYRHRGERLFPVGRLRGTWTNLELRTAQARGCRIEHVYRAVVAAETLHPFGTFISALWELRQSFHDPTDPRRHLAKLIMNNLYGRIGMREKIERTETREIEKADEKKSWKGKNWQIINGRGWLRETQELTFKNPWANVMWAAQTTAAVRVKLYGLLEMQGRSLVYADTDSVFSQQPISGLGTGLGGLSGHTEWEWAEIIGPKIYRYKPVSGQEEAKAKGVKREHALTFIRQGKVTYDQAVTLSQMFDAEVMAGTWKQVTPHRHLVPHRRPALHPDRLLQPYGWSDTIPPTVG